MSNHTRMVIRVIKTFLDSSVYSCHLFLISSTSVRFLLFLSYTASISAWNVPLISPVFLKRSLVFPILSFFPYFFALFIEEGLISLLFSGTLHSVGYIFLFFLTFASLLSSAICKVSSVTTLPSCISFSLEWFWSLPPVQCYKPLSIVIQALCLPDLESIRHLHCIIIWDLISVIPE